MRYVVVDLQGNQREAFDSRDELLDELREIRVEDTEALQSLYILKYDDQGHEVAPARRASDIFKSAQVSPTRTLLFDFVHAAVRFVERPESDPRFREFKDVARASAAVTGHGR